jgi:hypothetical protein
MNRTLAAMGAACLAAMSPLPLLAQAQPEWNDSRALELVRRATERRAAQLADTGLLDYQARAHGYVTFLAQLGEGLPDPPRVLKAEELALEVYWRAPNYSKQRIVGRRDTLLLPTDINYHRDHLGIVQNNFPTIIRLGDGDEVRDVPHPLSEVGEREYEFAVTDSLEIDLGSRKLAVYEIRFRPRDDRQPRAVGALYLERGEGQVARMTLGFTRSALKDEQLDDVSIVLDNGLVDGRFWLPRRQTIEIRRTGSWMDFPARGIIRGRWEICCVKTNVGVDPGIFAGPEIVSAPASQLRMHPWQGRIVDSLPPDMTAMREEDVRKVQSDARALVRAQALERARGGRFSARGMSDIVQFNRAEGLSLGAGLVQRLGNGYSLALRARYGFADREPKGEVTLQGESAQGTIRALSMYRVYADAGDVAESSRLMNSIAAQEFGTDYTELYDSRGVRVAVDRVSIAGGFARLSAGVEWQDAVQVAAVPASGSFRPTIGAAKAREERLEMSLRWRRGGPDGFLIHGATSLRASGVALMGPTGDWGERKFLGRFFGELEASLPAAETRVRGWLAAGLLTSSLGPHPVSGVPFRVRDAIPQSFVYFGGPVTGPGYAPHQFAATAAASARMEWQVPVWFPAISLGRFGKSGNRAVLAPFGHLVIIGDGPGTDVGVYPSVGAGLLTLFEMLRLDVARGLRNGRWTFSVDVERALWGIL